MRLTTTPNNKPRISHVALLAAGVFSLCCTPAHSSPLAGELQASVERQARMNHVCAVAYATVHAGQVSGSGAASGCDGMPAPSEDAVFQAASLSKPVFAYAILKLAQDGQFDLDKPLVQYLPQGYWHVQNPFSRANAPVTDRVDAPELQAVTARRVLNHTSGLPNWSGGPLVFDFAPGTGWQYSGEGFMLLQRVVETLTHEKLDDFMRRRLFEPLGMSNTAYQRQPRWAHQLVPGLSAFDEPRQFDFHAAIAPASLYTTARDYAKFLAAFLADTRAVQATVQAPVQVIPKLGLSWGLGWGMESGEKEIHIWQWGNNPGYRAFAMAAANSRDAVVVLTGSENGSRLAEPVVNAVLPGHHAAFKSYLIREGLSHVLCRDLDWCL
jgi:CubicO group peptidase (beta-lactamase class C family)